MSKQDMKAIELIDSAIAGLENIALNLEEGLDVPGEDKQQSKWMKKEIKKLKSASTQIHGTGTGKT